MTHIREIVEQDIAPISNLYVSVFNEPPWDEEWQTEWAKDRLTGIYNSPGFYGLLHEDSDKPITSVLGRSLTFKSWKEFEIVELFVNPKYQGNGIGSELVMQLEFHLKQNGYFKATLLTARDTQVEKFYSNRGFITSNRMIYMSHEL